MEAKRMPGCVKFQIFNAKNFPYLFQTYIYGNIESAISGILLYNLKTLSSDTSLYFSYMGNMKG